MEWLEESLKATSNKEGVVLSINASLQHLNRFSVNNSYKPQGWNNLRGYKWEKIGTGVSGGRISLAKQ